MMKYGVFGRDRKVQIFSRETFGRKVDLQKRDKISSHQASSTSVVSIEGSLTLKLASVGDTAIAALEEDVSSEAEITMTSSMFRYFPEVFSLRQAVGLSVHQSPNAECAWLIMV
ncbi:unnamed protein product [Prunus armeniaca]